uniref:Uncharacterized protein n=1 Tax=Sus scrofa TaxID=9823 RepID=A0A8D1F427_PIG
MRTPVIRLGPIQIQYDHSPLDMAQLTSFLLNAVGWLCSSPGAPVGVHPSLAPLAKILEGAGVEAKVEPEVKESLGVYCIDAYNETMTEKLVTFMKRGGGLLVGGQAWDWMGLGWK